MLPPNITDQILDLHPPSNEAGPNRIAWKLTNDGGVSSSFVYESLIGPLHSSRGKVFKAIWRWLALGANHFHLWCLAVDGLIANEACERRA